MAVHNEQIAHIFDELADLLEIEEANPFRVRAYRNAARTVRGLGRELQQMVSGGEDLTALPGIGKDLAGKIVEILTTGHATALDKLHDEVPASLEALLQIPGLGPKRVKALFHELHIETIAQLQAAARDGKLRELAGFGAKTEQSILDALAKRPAAKQQRIMRHVASQSAEPLVAYLRAMPGVDQVVVAGSYRRGQETVGDLDILATTRGESRVMEHFTHYDEVAQVLAQGATKATVVLRNSLQVDLRVVEQHSFGAALHYFTGSKAHNIQVRRLGQQRGLKINEYGVFRTGGDEERIAGDTEASVFAAVGLPVIPPELREARGEIEAAQAGRLPKLIELADLAGDLHVHTKASDGRATIEEMARAAQARGLHYIAITDHSRSLTIAHGLDVEQLARQIDEIERLNEQLDGITLLKGCEVDILEDGSLDMPDTLLARLDLVIGAVHTKFHLPARKQTLRILRAMDSRYFTLLAHPGARLLGERQAIAIDPEQIIKAAQARGCFLELNSQPQRLDLTDIYCQAAKQAGVLVAINSDSHGSDEFALLEEGIAQGRRGWLEKGDVLNARPLTALRKALRATMG